VGDDVKRPGDLPIHHRGDLYDLELGLHPEEPLPLGLRVGGRSTSFYGLSFVRVMFQYGVDYYFAKTQAAIALQQNVNLPNGVSANIQGSSLVGEIFRYQLVGPPHYGLTNLRTLQDWVVQRRLLAVSGVVQVVTWGGTTKTYDVEVDLHKLDAYGVTLPQILTALGKRQRQRRGSHDQRRSPIGQRPRPRPDQQRD
jgi:Cu/Ag efflux pump CusA